MVLYKDWLFCGKISSFVVIFVPKVGGVKKLAFVRLRKFWEKNSTAFIIHFHTITMILHKSMRFLLFDNFSYIC